MFNESLAVAQIVNVPLMLLMLTLVAQVPVLVANGCLLIVVAPCNFPELMTPLELIVTLTLASASAVPEIEREEPTVAPLTGIEILGADTCVAFIKLTLCD